MPKTDSSYLNNPKLKKAGVTLDFEEWQLIEYAKCSQDALYFIEKYVKVVTMDEGLVHIKLRAFQKRLITSMIENRFIIAKVPRQTGKSIAVICYFLWIILFHDFKRVAILANKAKSAMDLLSRLQLAYENLPIWIQNGVVEFNKSSVELENGSTCIAGSTSGSAGRSGSYTDILLDEFAFVPTNIAEDFYKSIYPTITSGQTTKLTIVSTPNGMNMFYEFWTKATKKTNSFIAIEGHWSEVPGRDEKWKEETIANIGEQAFEQEFNCSFLGSSSTLIKPTILEDLPAHFDVIKRESENLTVFDEPKEQHNYIITVDVARGSGLDYSAFTVIDVTSVPNKVVAVYRDNEISALLFPHRIYTAASGYNNAHVLVEINDIGGQIADILWYELEYENLLFTVKHPKLGQVLTFGGKKTTQLGVRTTTSVKKIGCANLKVLIETNKLLINDWKIFTEFTTFVWKGNTYQAEEGKNDDLVMCLVLFGWLTNQAEYKSLINQNISKELFTQNQKAIEERMIPPNVMVCDGIEEEPVMEKIGSDLWYSNIDDVFNFFKNG